MPDDTSSLHEEPDANAWMYVPEANYRMIHDAKATQQNADLDFGHVQESHLGGYPFWMLPEGEASPTDSIPSTSCPRCSNGEPLTLIAQLYVPLEDRGRVTYVFGCNAYDCTFFCAHRYAVPPGGPLQGPEMFSTGEGWGCAENAPVDQPTQASRPPQAFLDTNRPFLPFTSLIQQREVDAYERYLKHAKRQSDQIVEHSSPAECEPSEFADMPGQADESPEDEILHEYLQSSQRYPNRIALSCPKKQPVLICASQDVRGVAAGSDKADSSVVQLPGEKDGYLSGRLNVSSRVPPCGACGDPRHFEFQIFSTAVYLLGSGYGDWYMNDNLASLGTVMVFSCLNPTCGSGEYVPEYVAYQGGV